MTLINADRLKFFISRLPFLRPLALKIIKSLSRDINIRNPYTGDRLHLNLYRHKGYWFFGKGRERATMERFRQLISNGSVVVEIGGHIGFISQYFSELVGDSGRVVVFEPGTNNLPYMRSNTQSKRNISLVPMAISDSRGEAVFFEDGLTGQNNSLLADYKNASTVAISHREKLEKVKTVVQVTTLDDYLDEQGLACDFIKIDIEGWELNALSGMPKALRCCRAMMIEVTENHNAVSKILMDNNFVIEDAAGNKLMPIPDSFNGNVFALRLNAAGLDGDV